MHRPLPVYKPKKTIYAPANEKVFVTQFRTLKEANEYFSNYFDGDVKIVEEDDWESSYGGSYVYFVAGNSRTIENPNYDEEMVRYKKYLAENKKYKEWAAAKELETLEKLAKKHGKALVEEFSG